MQEKTEYLENEKVLTAEDLDSSSNSIENESDNNKVFVKSAEERAFVKRLNKKVLPLIFLVLFIQFCDKSALSVTAVMGMIEDTHLTGSQFNWVGSVFYLGYLICQVPNSYLIQKYPIGKYLGTMLIIWGVVVGCTALCQNFAQLMGLRFLLGLFEGCSYPCVYIIMNTLYRRSEQSACWGFVGLSTGMGSVLGVLIAYGVFYMEGLGGLRAWRWGYIIFGCGTVVIGLLTFFFLIDDTDHKLLPLTEREKEIVDERTRDNCVVKVKEIKTEQILEAVREPRLWILFIANVLNNLQTGALVTFSTLLVQGLGFSDFVSIILQIPNGFAGATFALGSALVAMRLKQNTFTCMGAAAISLVGCVFMAVLPGTSKLTGFYLSWANNGVAALLQTIISNNISGYTKKVFYNAVGMLALVLGNFIGPLSMAPSQAPKYTGPLIAYAGCNLVTILLLLLARNIMKNENKRRLDNPPEYQVDVHDDLTDKQNRNILYKL